jgi:hypothetical protein
MIRCEAALNHASAISSNDRLNDPVVFSNDPVGPQFVDGVRFIPKLL